MTIIAQIKSFIANDIGDKNTAAKQAVPIHCLSDCPRFESRGVGTVLLYKGTLLVEKVTFATLEGNSNLL